MKSSAVLLATMVAFSSAIAPAALYAQGAPQQRPVPHVDVINLSTGARASKIVGAAVYNGHEDKVGSVDDLIVHPNDGALFAVLSVGGFLGVGTHLVAVPYSSLEFIDGKVVFPGATKAMLKQLPEFRYKA